MEADGKLERRVMKSFDRFSSNYEWKPWWSLLIQSVIKQLMKVSDGLQVAKRAEKPLICDQVMFDFLGNYIEKMETRRNGITRSNFFLKFSIFYPQLCRTLT
jgi:hypothetical protein